MRTDPDCRFVEDALDRFRKQKFKLDHEAISAHVETCPSCYDRMAGFFRVLEVPESAYLDETIDDLTLSVYNLAKSLIKAPPAGADAKPPENVVFVHQPEAPAHYVEEGAEIAQDVQDYTGRDEFRGESLRGLKDLMQRSQGEFSLVFFLLDKGIGFGTPYSHDCRNLKGILLCQSGRIDEAERLFRDVIAAPAPDAYVRSVQVHAMNNLSFVCRSRGDIDQAIKWAVRSKALAEEIELDPFASLFGLMFFHLLRDRPGDFESAIGAVGSITSMPGGRVRLEAALQAPQNREVKELLAARGIADRFGLAAG